jgi:hypothetical protein
MTLTFSQVEHALPYDLYEKIVKIKLKTETRLNPMTSLLDKDGEMITDFDKLRILEMIENKSMTMECFADMLKVFEKMNDYNHIMYMTFLNQVRYFLIVKRMQSYKGHYSQIMKKLTDEEFDSLPQLFTNITSYGHTCMSPIRLASFYDGLKIKYLNRHEYKFSLEKDTPLYSAFEKICCKSGCSWNERSIKKCLKPAGVP